MCFNPNLIICISSCPSFPFGECTSYPGSSDGKESTCNSGDLGSIPGLGRSPAGGHGNALQYSCLENPHGQRSLAGCSPRGSKQLDVTGVQTCALPILCLTLCDPMDCSPPGSSVHGDSLGKNTGVGCHALLQGILLTQELNPGLPHIRQILYHLSHQGIVGDESSQKWLHFGILF